nr:baseplate hub subunit [uncultured Mediterranean phage uvMED]|tara:strand:- start:14833 stop:15552 length:720 start_codon:yes stop_codon:yes gene_type:complete
MPLPKISTPIYDLVLPSTEKKIKYRPFLVKEEKLLVLALETEDTKEITNAVQQVLNNCIQTKGIKVDKLPTFDIEYLFLNIRAKSVGESIEVNLICPDDGVTEAKVTINVDDIKIERDEKHEKTIKLGDDLFMDMKYPSLSEFIKSNFDPNEAVDMDASFELISGCVEKIYNEEEVWASEDVTNKELKDFLEGMNSTQFKQIETFFSTMPKLSHEVELKNPETGVKSKVTLEGLASFFA